MIEDQFDLTNALDERQRLKIDAIDYTGTLHFQKGAQVLVTDPLLGTIYSGYLYTDKEVPMYPSGAIVHSLDCVDQHYLADKRTATYTITTPLAAGVHVVKQWHDVLAAEGVNANAAYRLDTTQTDFNQGVLSNVIGTLNVGDGNLELATAGSAVLFSETIQSDFAAGTLTNVTATTLGLGMSSSSAIKLQATSNQTASGAICYTYLQIWVGSMTPGTNDTLNYEIWIDSGSPTQAAGVEIVCSDGTKLSTQATAVDAQGMSAAPSTDLSGLAGNAWYTRAISTAGLNGKTISYVAIAFQGTSTGTYTAYFRNIYLTSQSGSKFFSTTLQTNPPVQLQRANFSDATIAVVNGYGIATVGLPRATYVRYSPSLSVSAAQVLRSSILTFIASLPSNATASIRASWDGGITFQPCTNNTNLAGMLAGASVAGDSLILEETLATTSNDPTVTPLLTSVMANVQSAAVCTTRNDFTKTWSSSADWNSGTLSNVIVASATWPLATNWITLNGYTHTFANADLSGMSTFTSGTGSVTILNKTANVLARSSGSGFVDAKLEITPAGNWQNFTAAVDITPMSSPDGTDWFGIIYRTTAWNNTEDTYAYLGGIRVAGTLFAKGSNSTSSGSHTQFGTPFSTSISGTHRLMLVISGSTHNLYLDGILVETATDATFSASGGIGLLTSTDDLTANQNQYSQYTNFGVVATTSGTWTSASTSIASVVTYGSSIVTWRNDEPSTDAVVVVQTSIDGGSTYQTCTNGGAIPNLTAGQSLSGISVIVKITLTTNAVIALPKVSGLRITVSNPYSSLTGTRSTVPLGNDTATRINQSGIGTAFDGQTYTKVGTGTDAIHGNEITITNTTGDVHELLGSRTALAEEGTVRFALSASTMAAGLELLYLDVNNFYRLAATSTALTLWKNFTGTLTQLATSSATINTGTYYRMRFRAIAGTVSTPSQLYGKVWSDNTLEPVNWTVTASD